MLAEIGQRLRHLLQIKDLRPSRITRSLSFSELRLNIHQQIDLRRICAQVIDSDQGALGGNTIVDVDEKGSFNLLLFRIEKKPQRVYLGEWGEYEGMQIHWKDDDCLVINSVEYELE